jgi:hypothetical protein
VIVPAAAGSSTDVHLARAGYEPPSRAVDVHVDMDVDDHPPCRPTSRGGSVTDPALAYRLVAELAEDRRARGHHISPTQVERAAALLVDLWAAAARHGIGTDHWGHAAHLPRAALDTISAPPRRPPGSRPRPRRWQHRQPIDR